MTAQDVSSAPGTTEVDGADRKSWFEQPERHAPICAFAIENIRPLTPFFNPSVQTNPPRLI